jgi:hypothetical protein
MTAEMLTTTSFRPHARIAAGSGRQVSDVTSREGHAGYLHFGAGADGDNSLVVSAAPQVVVGLVAVGRRAVHPMRG